MNGTTSLTFQQQLESLSLILEHWLPFLEQMELIEKNIEDLPSELESVRQYIHRYNQSLETDEDHSWLGSLSAKPSANKEQVLYLKLQNILASLDEEIPHLLFLEKKIKNLICLREVTEALQENIRTQSIPSDNFDVPVARNNRLIRERRKKPRGIWQSLSSWWQNTISTRRFKKRMQLAVFFGLILMWNLFSNFIYTHVTDKNFDVQVNQMEHRLENIEIHNFID